MHRPAIDILLLVLAFTSALPLPAQEKKKREVHTDPAAAGEDYRLQGEYLVELSVDGKPARFGVQVRALGSHRFEAVCLAGGLPGEGWDGKTRRKEEAEAKEGVLAFGGLLKGTAIRDGALTLPGAEGGAPRKWEKLSRKSPTLGMKPPPGAVVLFDGSSAAEFEGGKLTDGLLHQGAKSRRKFQGCTLHLEFRTPFMPSHRGQDRGNSGCYLQGRYEVQVLDSFGLEGRQDECGGIYSVGPPSVNMCFPPLEWQTYDIEFIPARFGPDGKKTDHARMTVRHNGVLVHRDVVADHATTAAPVGEGPDPGPLYLQDHGSPVRYRNIWLVEKGS